MSQVQLVRRERPRRGRERRRRREHLAAGVCLTTVRADGVMVKFRVYG